MAVIDYETEGREVECPSQALLCNALLAMDPGCQYTSLDWITVLSDAGIKISMDGRGRYLDNIFIERLWRSLKQEAIYLHEMRDGFHVSKIIDDWIRFYNTDRPHTALDKSEPDEVCFKTFKARIAA